MVLKEIGFNLIRVCDVLKEMNLVGVDNWCIKNIE